MSDYFIGWDVGGWNCDRNPSSRDALVILDQGLAIVGRAWRGNLRVTINEAATADVLISAIFALCDAEYPDDKPQVILAIDTPLAFSQPFANLILGRGDAGTIGVSRENPYLFRWTERYLAANGIQPLSAIKDMIGSQATKGMHVLARFAPKIVECGLDLFRVRLTPWLRRK